MSLCLRLRGRKGGGGGREGREGGGNGGREGGGKGSEGGRRVRQNRP